MLGRACWLTNWGGQYLSGCPTCCWHSCCTLHQTPRDTAAADNNLSQALPSCVCSCLLANVQLQRAAADNLRHCCCGCRLSDALLLRVCSCLQVEVQLRPTAREAFQRIKTVMQEAQPLTQMAQPLADGSRLQSLADRPMSDVSSWHRAEASNLAAGLHCSGATLVSSMLCV